MSTIKERAVEACLEYDEAKRTIDELTSQIHNRFTACEQRQQKKLKYEWDGKEPEWKFNMNVLSEVDPCLQMYDNGHDYRCEDCKQAYQLIQDRKEARQQFGITKRKVRAVARAQKKTETD